MGCRIDAIVYFIVADVKYIERGHPKKGSFYVTGLVLFIRSVIS